MSLRRGREARLLAAALGMFDTVSPRQLRLTIEGKEEAARLRVSHRSARAFLRALEREFPGILDDYLERHAELHEAEQ